MTTNPNTTTEGGGMSRRIRALQLATLTGGIVLLFCDDPMSHVWIATSLIVGCINVALEKLSA